MFRICMVQQTPHYERIVAKHEKRKELFGAEVGIFRGYIVKKIAGQY